MDPLEKKERLKEIQESKSNSQDHFSIKNKTDYEDNDKKYKIKVEAELNVTELSFCESTSFEMCHKDDVKFEIDEPIIDLKCENNKLQDPLNVTCQIKGTFFYNFK